MEWLKGALTDREGEFDTGRILVAVVVLAMCFMQAWDVIANKVQFNAGQFGAGIGAVLAGFAAYIYTDRPSPNTTTTVVESKKSSVINSKG